MTSILLMSQQMFQLRAAMSIDDKCSIKLVLPHKMYRRFLQELQKLGTKMEEQDGHLILRAVTGDNIHIFSSDKASEIFELHLQ